MAESIQEAPQSLATALMVPVYVGWNLHCSLYGVCVALAAGYLSTPSFAAESRRMRIYIWTVLALETIAFVVSWMQSITYGSTQHRDAATLFIGTFYWDALPSLLTASVSGLVQLFLVRRAVSLLRNRQPKIRLAVLSIASLFIFSAWVSALAITVLFLLYASDEAYQTLHIIYLQAVCTGLLLWLSAATDIAITTGLWLAIKPLSSSYKGTTSVLKSLVRSGIETAALTSIVATLGAIVAVAFPSSSVNTVTLNLAFLYPIPALYTITFLVTLSAKARMQQKLNKAQDRRFSAAIPAKNFGQSSLTSDGDTENKTGLAVYTEDRQIISFRTAHLEIQPAVLQARSPVLTSAFPRRPVNVADLPPEDPDDTINPESSEFPKNLTVADPQDMTDGRRLPTTDESASLPGPTSGFPAATT